jgi:hypothetical protein
LSLAGIAQRVADIHDTPPESGYSRRSRQEARAEPLVKKSRVVTWKERFTWRADRTARDVRKGVLENPATEIAEDTARKILHHVK